jgi:transposase
MEVGTHSPWVSRLLTALGHEVVVANPRRVRLIAESDHKHDRADAEQLARLGRLDPQLLSPIQHRGIEAQEDLALLRSRDSLVAARTTLINHVRGVVKSVWRSAACVLRDVVSPQGGAGDSSGASTCPRRSRPDDR